MTLILNPIVSEPVGRTRNRMWLKKRIHEAGSGRRGKQWWLDYIDKLNW